MKSLLLHIDDEKFYALKSLKVSLELVDKKDLSWEDFLCDWVLFVFEHFTRMEFDKAVEETFLSTLKPEAKQQLKERIETIMRELKWRI